MATVPMYDVPPLGRVLKLRGLRLSIVLDEFTPTQFDAWRATAYVDGAPVPAVVVRHAGDVTRRGIRPARRGDVPPRPDGDAILGVVVEDRGASAVWLPAGDPGARARDLSRADWRLFV